MLNTGPGSKTDISLRSCNTMMRVISRIESNSTPDKVTHTPTGNMMDWRKEKLRNSETPKTSKIVSPSSSLKYFTER